MEAKSFFINLKSHYRMFTANCMKNIFMMINLTIIHIIHIIHFSQSLVLIYTHTHTLCIQRNINNFSHRKRLQNMNLIYEITSTAGENFLEVSLAADLNYIIFIILAWSNGNTTTYRVACHSLSTNERRKKG
jgi:cell division protein FtsL